MNTQKIIAKLGASALVASLVLGSASFASAANAKIRVETRINAETPTSTKNVIQERNEIRNEWKQGSTSKAEAKAEMKTKRVEAKIEIKSKLDEKRKSNVKKVIDNRINAYQKHIKQLSDRIVRIETIIGKATTSTTVAVSALAEAKIKLANASTTLATINANASTTVSASNPSATLQTVKVQFDSVQEDIKAAHKKISEAISSLKVKVESNATTTASTTTTN